MGVGVLYLLLLCNGTAVLDPSEITTAWRYKHGLRTQLVRDYKSACSL